MNEPDLHRMTLHQAMKLADAVPSRVIVKFSNGASASVDLDPDATSLLPLLANTLTMLDRQSQSAEWSLCLPPDPARTPDNSLPRWQCHKIVEAFLIESMIFIPDDPANPLGGGKSPRKLRGKYSNWTAIVSKEYLEKHKPQIGGYYVRYEDDYESFSPREAFEQGYTLV